MAESGERTEKATERRMKEVREKGQLSRSQDLTAWVGVGAAVIMLPGVIARASNALADQMFTAATMAANPDPLVALGALENALGTLAGILGPLLIAVAAAVAAAAAVQGGIRFKKFKPRFEQFDVFKGLKNVAGAQALWNGAKALLKTAVVGLVLYTVVQGLVPALLQAGGLQVSELLGAAGGGVARLVQYAVAAGMLLALADVFVISRRNRKKTRMTKKEVKDENKSSDGDPMIKSARRQRQLAMARSRMMSAVAGADVVLVNPVHVAVALRYEPGRSAPRVVAKGADRVAARIRAEAEAKKVPMVRDIPLARALHGACELGAEIPVELYNQVAAVLAFVMALKKRGSAAGMHQILPAGSAIPPGPALAGHALDTTKLSKGIPA
ncbi:EscU/YscU/HrcU family type III secretion system export apparatus switch protein [Arthrobacter sp. STN4]|uniref:EscU/YscU/HrcU family type III secretion system export apparatus switch protein n=1 Tax=Arthrobacter sp. STN4 TaxID=2923276 RepID=UPI00211A6C39|nr:EscU/YscU/HrcU family type III secretion system export apparatus switch protein [Arthrobacter sp. STN4]MCQ9162518.1 EscU/YscU/HrcU family type III secretion system export apparatus switch protein [Arthrobacter sp. STN4]